MGVVMLVRHGQASFGTHDYDRLSANGVSQCRRAGETLSAFGIDPKAFLHGGLRRQRESAEEMLRASSWQLPLHLDPRWDEFDHNAVISAYPELSDDERASIDSGDIEPRAFQRLFEQATARWCSGSYDDDYPESFIAFIQRVRAAMAHAGRMAGPRTTAIVMSSGGPIAAAAAMLTGPADDPVQMSGHWQRFHAVIVNASVTRVVVGSTGARLLTFNEHSHLDRSLLTYR